MRFFQTLVLSALASLGSAAAVPRDQPAQYDAIIIGGGPAGLAALSGLARVRRNVLLIDSGSYRNQPTRHMHDVLGFDGVTPAWYRYGARQQLQHYDTITMTNGTVTKIEPAENNTRFTVTTVYEDKSEQKITTRKVVLATGLHDILPKTPGVEEIWGEGIYWCPWCDGHEHADQPLGFLAPLDQVPGMVREILTLNRDIIAFVNGTDTPAVREATTKKETGDWQAFLKIHGVRIENRTISEIVRLKNGSDGHADPSLPSVAEFDSFNVGFETGDPVERAAFFASFKDEQASKIGEDVGVKLYNGRLAVDPTKGLVTNIPGIYAIGDANSDNVTNVPHALFSGKRTAVYLHVQLGRENEVVDLATYKDAPSKRDLHVEARELWDTVNGQPGDALYAGTFDHGL